MLFPIQFFKVSVICAWMGIVCDDEATPEDKVPEVDQKIDPDSRIRYCGVSILKKVQNFCGDRSYYNEYEVEPII
ncbi:hypothetical protein Ciccas_011302 [Cichlidogyrus casuarinus]|uniref:Secreted protein n=1 Tax=Cichlidogyrus casuarinus TaxID=1844966 RepID=A0ABD2PTN9_9PLAT